MRICHRAPWVVPVSAPVIEDGAVLVEDGRILAVGPYRDFPDEETVRDHEESVLTPALVNCHCHLELSHLAALGRGRSPRGDICAWIEELLIQRAAAGEHDDHHLAVARAVLAGLHGQGTGLVADIGNDPESAVIGHGSPCRVLFFLELLGLTKGEAERKITLLEGVSSATMCTGHAPYSTRAELLVALKERARRLGHPFPVHVAESAAEASILEEGGGPMQTFLEKRGALDATFTPPGTSPVAYLDRLGLLDNKTLCVHCVEVGGRDIEILADSKARICLCPGSNRFLGVGRAPVARMLARGIRPGLGTDSAASNPDLSIWEEMRLVREEHAGIEPEEVFRMATVNGARALGAHDLGSLEPGGSGRILAVGTGPIGAGDVFESLTSAGLDARPEWI